MAGLIALAVPAGTATAGSYRALGWGNNGSWQLGDGSSTADKLRPTVIPGLTSRITALTAGTSGASFAQGYGLALLDNGTVQAWGSNVNGELGDGTNTNRSTPHAVANLADVVAISSGGSHNLALLRDGTVRAWGLNTWGQLGDGTNVNKNLPGVVSGLSDVVAIAAGGRHSLALRADGTVWAWGWNENGQVGDGGTTDQWTPHHVPNLTSVRAIAGGGWHSLALLSDGSLRAWGDNSNGQLGSGTSGGISTTPITVANLANVTSIAAGGYHSLAVFADGTLWAWGWNSYGQIGDNTTTTRPLPVQVTGVGGVVASIAAGYGHSLARLSDGSVLAWGWNANGQLGDGTATNRATPVVILGRNSNIRLIAAPAWGPFSYAA